MLHIKRINNQVVYMYENANLKPAKDNACPILVPKVPSKRVPFEQWLEKNKREVEYIYTMYTKTISSFHTDKHVAKYNDTHFHQDISRWIYKSSSSAMYPS